jgi:phosphocarrier protein HPr
MIETEVEVINRAGIHTRPSALIVKCAAKFKSEVNLIREGFSINGKSIIGVMQLSAAQGTKITVQCEGEDEQEAANALSTLFGTGFDEM